MGDTAWFLVIGLLLTAMAFAGSVLQRAPLSAAILYLAAGYAVGPAGAGMLDLRLPAGAAAVERLADVAVLVSLFTAGLKLRVPPGDRRWLLPLRLAFLSMAVTVGLITLVGVYLLGLPLGAAVLLGAIIAPTDPVLASDVLHLRRRHREAVGLDDFLALGLIALSFGVADLIHAYGFLAVFAAGVALRRVEMRESGDASREELRERRKEVEEEDLATDPRTAPTHLTRTVLRFNEHLERIGEVAVVLALGSLLSAATLTPAGWWFVPLVFLAVRPAATWAGLAGSSMKAPQRALVGWFGVRGVGSVYYLAFALTHGVPEPLAGELTRLTLTVVAASVVVHGVSVTPLMTLYGRMRGRRAS